MGMQTVTVLHRPAFLNRDEEEEKSPKQPGLHRGLNVWVEP